MDKQEIINIAQIDSFFMEDVWRDADLKSAQGLVNRLLEIHADILAQYHGLEKRDMLHLARSSTYHAISVFIDTCYRLQMLLKADRLAPCGIGDFKHRFDAFFSERFLTLPLGSSRVLRCNLANLILSNWGYCPLYGAINNDPELITLKQTGILPSDKQDIWLLSYYLGKLPEKIISSLKICANKLRKKLKTGLIRIGYIVLDKKYMLQLPGVEFVPLDAMAAGLESASEIKKQNETYAALRDKFISKARQLDYWYLLPFDRPSDDFLAALLRFILLRSEGLLCDKERLKQEIEYCAQNIKALKVQALFSVDNWFRFQNAVIAAAARQLSMPVIEYQLGGRLMYEQGEGFEDCELGGIDFFLAWGRWKGRNTQEPKPKFFKVPDPFLLELNARGEKICHNLLHRKRERLNILCSLSALSEIFNTDISGNYRPDLMKNHHRLILKAIEKLDSVSEGKNIKLFIKVKGFGYALHQGHEYMLFPQYKMKNIKVEYIFKANSQHYFYFADAHFYDGLATILAQSMAYNIPSVVFLNTRILKVFPEYQPLIERMREAGVIVTNPDELCSSFENIYSNRSRWFQKDVQDIRKEFLELFAYFNNNWKVELQNTLIAITKGTSYEKQ